MKNAILILTNKDSDKIVELFNDIKLSLGNTYDIFILYNKINYIPETIKKTNYIEIENSVFNEFKIKELDTYYPPLYTGNTLYFNEQLALFKFYKEHNNYDYYWFMEDDVRFNGNWSLFFNEYENDKTDFLSASIRWLVDDPKFPLKNSFKCNISIPFEKILISLNSIYRMSNNAVNHMIKMYQTECSGHHEITYATLLNHYNFSISDFGSNGKFVNDNYKNKFYNPTIDEEFIYTFGFRPIREKVGDLTNILYHPVKDF